MRYDSNLNGAITVNYFQKMTKIPEDTPVTEWYNGKTVFITGGSGFMGKVLVEKLLYACPKIKQLYILIRAKRGKTPQQRINMMWKSPVSRTKLIQKQ